MPIDKAEKTFVAGHRGLVGSALVRKLEAGGFTNLLKRDRSQLDLMNDGGTLCHGRRGTFSMAFSISPMLLMLNILAHRDQIRQNLNRPVNPRKVTSAEGQP